jgi:hypothetical protein
MPVTPLDSLVDHVGMQYSPISLLRKDVRGDVMSSKQIESSFTKTLTKQKSIWPTR